jgi:hypothetical protein
MRKKVVIHPLAARTCSCPLLAIMRGLHLWVAYRAEMKLKCMPLNTKGDNGRVIMIVAKKVKEYSAKKKPGRSKLRTRPKG